MVTPYVLGGAAIGSPLHDLLTVLFVQDVETAFDDTGVVVSGMARFSIDVSASPLRYTPPLGFSIDATGTAHHRTTRQAGAFWDFPDISIRFRLTAPRTFSPVVDLVLAGSPGNPPAPANAAVPNILTGAGTGPPPANALLADAPNTVFRLDLLVDAATLHLPFLTPAMLNADGRLAPDPSVPDVTVTLPKIKLNPTHTANQPPYHTFVAHLTTQDRTVLTYAAWKSPGIGGIFLELVLQSRTHHNPMNDLHVLVGV